MLEPARIARAEERRQAVGTAEIAGESEPIAGGVMSFTAPGSWSNQACGLGLDGAVSDAELDRLVEFYVSRGVEPKIEVCPYADESVIRGLAARGFEVREFESVFARDAQHPVRAEAPAGIDIRWVDPGDDEAVRACALVTSREFHPKDAPVPASELAIAERCIRHPRSDSFVAWAGDDPVGGGSMETADAFEGVRVACLFGGAVRAEFRRRGIQRALIAARVEKAAQRGGDVVCIHTSPGIPTERNALRLGFTPCYTKVVLAKRGEGLLPSPPQDAGALPAGDGAGADSGNGAGSG